MSELFKKHPWAISLGLLGVFIVVYLAMKKPASSNTSSALTLGVNNTAADLAAIQGQAQQIQQSATASAANNQLLTQALSSELATNQTLLQNQDALNSGAVSNAANINSAEYGSTAAIEAASAATAYQLQAQTTQSLAAAYLGMRAGQATALSLAGFSPAYIGAYG